MSVIDFSFKRKMILFASIQVVLLSFLLMLSVVMRIVFYPFSYLESYPLYFMVGFFFLWEIFQFFRLYQIYREKRTVQLSKVCLVRILIAIPVGVYISLRLSECPMFTASLFLMFLGVECIFDSLYYKKAF